MARCGRYAGLRYAAEHRDMAPPRGAHPPLSTNLVKRPSSLPRSTSSEQEAAQCFNAGHALHTLFYPFVAQKQTDNREGYQNSAKSTLACTFGATA